MLDATNGTKDVAPAFFRFMGIPYQGEEAPVPKTLREFAQAPADEPWVYSCLRRNFLSMQQVPLRVYEKKGRNIVPLEETNRPDGQDLQDLLDNVNMRSMNGADFRGYTAAAYGAWGGSYWKKVRGKLGGPPQELYWLPAPDTEPKKDPAAVTVIDSFIYQPQNTTIRESYKPRDVLSFRSFNMADPTQLLSPLSAGRYDISISRQATMQAASVLANWSIPAGAWVAPPNEEISTSDVNLIRRALRALRGPRNQGKTPVLPKGLTWTPMALNPKDAEWLQARKVSRLTVCGLIGVPLLLAGDDESTGPYAYAREIKRWYWENTVVGIGQQMTDTIDGWLVPDFDRTRTLTARFDYSEIEALKPTIPEQHTFWQGMIDRRVVVPNEYRRYFKLGPDLKWGDLPVLSTRLDPQNAQGEPEPSARITAVPQPDAVQVANAVRALKHLYTVPEVGAYMNDPAQSLDTAFLDVPVSEAMRQTLELGIRRRYSSAQIAEGVPADNYPGIATKEADVAPPVFNITLSPNIVMPSELTIPPAQITVNVPEQAAPVVNVAAAEVNVPAPVVNVAAAEAPSVNVAAPNVTVNVPKTKRRLVRDDSGQISGIEDE